VDTRAGEGWLSAPSIALGGVGDGVHAWRVRVRDVAGNEAYAAGPSAAVVDTTKPTVELGVPGGWLSTLPLDLTTHDNLEDHLGLGTTDVEANLAADGTSRGSWLRLAQVPGVAGRRTLVLPLAGLADGAHQLRVRVRNGGPFAAALQGERTATVNVDNTSPALRAVSFAPEGPDRVRVSWTGEDARAGVARTTVQWLSDSGWQTLQEGPAGNGAQSLLVDTTGVPSGSRAFRLLVADAAGNTAMAASPGGISVDHQAPEVGGLRLDGGPPWRLSWSQTDPVGGFGDCATRIQVTGPGTQQKWRDLISVPAAEGPQSVVLPVDGLAPGAYRVRVVVCDAAGASAAAETGGLLIPSPGTGQTVVVVPPGGAGSTAKDPFARLRSARLILRVAKAHLERWRGRPTLVRHLTYGDAVLISGRLRAANGRPIARAEVQARGYLGRPLGHTLTRRDGRFRLTVRPEATGAIQVGVPAGKQLLPTRRPVGIRVLVRPTVSVRASSHTALAFGAPVRFVGRLRPAPALLGGYARKAVVLEWRDPIRRVWRPVLNARARRDGTFTLTWRFGVRGLTIPMRVRVPVERGWPLERVITRPIRIKIT
jgi:hypothetical protein